MQDEAQNAGGLAVTPQVRVPAEPYPFEAPRGALALLVIDMQRDFLEPGGFGAALGNDVGRLAACVPAVGALLDAFRKSGLPVFHTLEAHAPDLSDCPPSKRARGRGGLRIGDPGPMGRILVAGEPGNAIVPELAPLPSEIALTKPGKGAFYGTPLDALLRARGVTHLVLAGVTTEVCVQTTMREANDRGYECLLVEEATESYFEAFKQSTLAMVRAQGGIVGWTARLEDVIASLEASEASEASEVSEVSGPPGAARAPRERPRAFAGFARGLAADPATVWAPFRPGVEIHRIYGEGPGRPGAVLLRYAEGASVPRHAHDGYEHVFVLTGSQRDEHGHYGEGSLVVNPPGSSHAVTSDDGCVVLVVWEKAPFVPL